MQKHIKQETEQRLYNKILATSEIPIIEISEIYSKGLCLSSQDKNEIYIKQPLPLKEKLKVLLHEYSHYIHLTYYHQNESRSECEIIANGSAFLICHECELRIIKGVDLCKFSDDESTINRLRNQIKLVSKHVLDKILPIWNK